MASRAIIFDGHSLLHLLIHYLQDHEDQIPLDAELVSAGVSPVLAHWVGLVVESDHWDAPPEQFAPDGTLKPLHVRYEGKKTLAWGSHGETVGAWQEAIDSPTK